jgi:addiction module HigA family antidote
MSGLKKIPAVGEVLASEFLEPMSISQNALAKALGIPQNRLSEIINGKRGVSADTDLRLCKYFGLSDVFFPDCKWILRGLPPNVNCKMS